MVKQSDPFEKHYASPGQLRKTVIMTWPWPGVKGFRLIYMTPLNSKLNRFSNWNFHNLFRFKNQQNQKQCQKH